MFYPQLTFIGILEAFIGMNLVSMTTKCWTDSS